MSTGVMQDRACGRWRTVMFAVAVVLAFASGQRPLEGGTGAAQHWWVWHRAERTQPIRTRRPRPA